LSKLIGKIDQDQSKEIIKQILQGLVYLHEDKKTLHRDIKPDNILLLNGLPKIADLGISKKMRTESLLSKSCTPFYAAPEMFYEENYDFNADIWSLGIVFLELLSGKRITDLVKGIKPPAERADFPSEELLNQIKDPTLRDLVKRMLEKDPKNRLKAK
jgi:serine/threonine-protein kinase 24/25/MST4